MSKNRQHDRFSSSTLLLRMVLIGWIVSCQPQRRRSQLGMVVQAFVQVVVPSATTTSRTGRMRSSSPNNNNDDDDHHSKHPGGRLRRRRKRDVFLQDIIMGFQPRRTKKRTKESSVVVQRNNITTLSELDAHWNDTKRLFRRRNNHHHNNNGRVDYTALLRAAHVQGNTQIIGNPNHPNYTHPVAHVIHQRKQQLQLQQQDRSTTKPIFSDGCKVGLAVEGGGMRGCVSAGMVCAIHHLNLTDTIDVIYGSSAGSIVSAYLITGQLPWFGPEVYYDRLPAAGKQFIDTKRLLRAIGFGLLDPRLLKDVVTRRSEGKPVLNLHYLMKTTMQETKPLDWEKFRERQKVQPLNVVTSGLKAERSIVLNMENGGFDTLEELTDCMHASCLLPGIAGAVMNLDKRIVNGEIPPITTTDDPTMTKRKMKIGNNLPTDRYEPLADALLFEPLPYRTAVSRDNVTHCIVIRSRPDGVDVTGKGGIFEKLIAKRFFQRKNNLPHMYQRMKMQLHKKLYAEDVIRLNEAAHDLRDPYDVSEPHLMAIAVPPGSEEVTRLEVDRNAIFRGLRRGFARAYDCLVPDPALRGKGIDVAELFFPDEILDYDPQDIDVTDESAFAAYMKLHGVNPKAWKDEDFWRDEARFNHYLKSHGIAPKSREAEKIREEMSVALHSSAQGTESSSIDQEITTTAL